MPMSWTPENDRLLLLKLVETHGISVNADAIVAAWPTNGAKPTSRAIKERFVKLRQLAGVNGKTSTTTTPRAPRTYKPKTPSTSAKKRKVQQDTSESDADEHATEEDTPTVNRKSAQRGGAGRGRTLFANVKGDGDGNGTPEGTGIRIKTEANENPNFNQLSARASKLSASMNDPFASYNGNAVNLSAADDVNGNYGMQPQPSYFDFNGSLGDMNGYGNNGMAFDNHTYTGTMGLGVPVQHMADSHGQLLNTQRTASNNNEQPLRRSVASSDASFGHRARSARKASQQASEGWRQQDRDEYMSAEKSSDEDSQVSEFQDCEDEI